jgi:DnaK suppressor protein
MAIRILGWVELHQPTPQRHPRQPVVANDFQKKEALTKAAARTRDRRILCIMDKNATDWFRTQLLEQREQVSAEWVAHRRLSDPNEDRSPGDFGDLGSHATGRLIEERIASDHEQLLRKIDHALERLDAGTYRVCEGCGEEIPMERLRAKPSASLCVTCQEAKDQREAQIAQAIPPGGEEPPSLRYPAPGENVI